MAKHDTPPLILVVGDDGKLSGATEYDYERICEYQCDTQLIMTPYEGRDPTRLRQYWAILGRLVKDAPTPWSSKEEASDALKLALGITDIGKTVTGQWMIRPGSVALANMEDVRFKNFFEQAMAVLAKVTGVDPVTFGREAADTNSNTQRRSPPPSAQRQGGGRVPPDSSPPAPTPGANISPHQASEEARQLLRPALGDGIASSVPPPTNSNVSGLAHRAGGTVKQVAETSPVPPAANSYQEATR